MCASARQYDKGSQPRTGCDGGTSSEANGTPRAEFADVAQYPLRDESIDIRLAGDDVSSFAFAGEPPIDRCRYGVENIEWITISAVEHYARLDVERCDSGSREVRGSDVCCLAVISAANVADLWMIERASVRNDGYLCIGSRHTQRLRERPNIIPEGDSVVRSDENAGESILGDKSTKPLG